MLASIDGLKTEADSAVSVVHALILCQKKYRNILENYDAWFDFGKHRKRYFTSVTCALCVFLESNCEICPLNSCLSSNHPYHKMVSALNSCSSLKVQYNITKHRMQELLDLIEEKREELK